MTGLEWIALLRWVVVMLVAGGLVWSYSGWYRRGCWYALVGVVIGMVMGWLLLWAMGLV
jgi:hypothetical protein